MQPYDYKNARLEDLLARYRESDPAAFKEVFKRTSNLVFNFLCMKLGSRSEAEDVMQDTYFRVHRYITSYDDRRGALAWLMSITRNAMYDHIRLRRGLAASTSIDALERASHELDSEKLAELRQMIQIVSRDLTDQERDLLVDRVFNHSSYEDIAHSQGLSPENARQKISRLLKRLRSRHSVP